MARFTEDIDVSGAIRATSFTGAMNRSNIIAGDIAIYEIPFTRFRVHDAMQTNLPAIGSSDDLGLATGVLGTAMPYFKTQDMNAVGAITEYARTVFTIPDKYYAGGSISLRIRAGMLISVASVTATVDAQVYVSSGDTLVSADICTTAATSANSLTFANCDFTITPTSRVPGDIFDIRIAWIGNSATASSHFGAITNVAVLVSNRG